MNGNMLESTYNSFDNVVDGGFRPIIRLMST